MITPPPRGPAPDLAERVRALVRRLDRLAPSRRDPEQFHETKSELIAEIRDLAAALKGRAR